VNSILGQEYTFSDLLNKIKGNSSFRYFNNDDLRLNKVKNFDFTLFEPVNSSEFSNYSYNLYSEKNEIVKIGFISKNHQFELFRIAEFDSLFVYAIYIIDKKINENGYFLDALIVFNEHLKNCIYINCYHLISSVKIVDENDNFLNNDYSINPFADISKVYSIFLLDKNLEATNRLNFNEGICSSMSKILKNSNVYSEQICIYVDENPLYLKDIKLKWLYNFLEQGIHRNIGISATVYPEPFDDYPIYFFAGLKYK
jgi:hypothetical protein